MPILVRSNPGLRPCPEALFDHLIGAAGVAGGHPTAMAKNPSTIRAAAGRQRDRRVYSARGSDTPHNEYKNARSWES
jgi:hypothetical protein